MQVTNTCRVELIGSIGDDRRVVDAARVSHFKRSVLINSSTNDLAARDARLIRYLAKHNPWTPFAHVVVTLRIACPIFVARQWFKHQIGVNEERDKPPYVDIPPEFFLPDVIRKRPKGNIKQGSGDCHPNGDELRSTIRSAYAQTARVYAEMIADGMAPEQARMILPLAAMTEFIETGSLAYYARVAKLRLANDAQREIHDLMHMVALAIQPIAPVSWAALMGDVQE